MLRAHALAVLAPARTQLARERLVARHVRARGLCAHARGLGTAGASRCARVLFTGKATSRHAYAGPALQVTTEHCERLQVRSSLGQG